MFKFIIFLAVSFFLLQADTHPKKSIFILHSYSQEYGWTKLQHEGFVDKIEKDSSSALEISVEYLDTKRLAFSKEYQTFFVAYLQKKYKNYQPDAIYVTDDNALNFFVNHSGSLFSDAPLFFSGINNIALSRSLDPHKYAGVYETKDIVPNIELIRQFSPQTRDIWIVGDDSTTYRSIEADIRSQISKYPNHTFHFIASPRIDAIRAKLPKSTKSFVVLTTIGGLSDADGRNLTLQESIARLKQNKNLILCSMEDAYVFGGVIGGYVTSGKLQGERAAELAIRHLNGEPLKDIHSVLKSPNTYMFDRHSLVESRLILSEYTARNAIVLCEDKTFFEKYQGVILNSMFIFFIFFFIFLIIVFFLFIQKNDQLKKLKKELDDTSAELSSAPKRLDSSDDVNE